MHNVTLRRVRPTVVAVKKRKELDISSVIFLPYPARKPHFFWGGRRWCPYYIVLCGLSSSSIFFYIIS